MFSGQKEGHEQEEEAGKNKMHKMQRQMLRDLGQEQLGICAGER